MDQDLQAALKDAYEAMSPAQSDEFRRRFRRLCENALISNNNDSEVRRVLELVVVDLDEDG
ncbi:hypothetical protein [Methylobacterium bullatum]|uniref:hypothetical protein n=1 Tax=Methylobacterium bullatum TaxID=570505 RepID=UPI0030D55205